MSLLGALFGIIWQFLFFQVTPLGGIPIGGGGGGGGTSFVTGETLGSSQSTGGTCDGFVFTVGASSINVVQLGRWVLSGNTGTHTLSLTTGPANGTSLANCSVNTSGQGVGFTYCPITSTTLSASTQYGLFDMSNSGTDSYYIIPSTTITHTSVATTNGGTYGSISGNNCNSMAVDTDSTTYGPLDFKYQ